MPDDHFGRKCRSCATEISSAVVLYLADEPTASRAIVQSAGYRLIGPQLKAEFDRNGEMHLCTAALHARIHHTRCRPRSAKGITRWTSNCAAGCCCSRSPIFPPADMTQEVIATTLGYAVSMSPTSRG